MYLISVPHLKEIHVRECCFTWLKVIVVNWWEEETCEENWTISETHISQTAYPIFVKFGM